MEVAKSDLGFSKAAEEWAERCAAKARELGLTGAEALPESVDAECTREPWRRAALFARRRLDFKREAGRVLPLARAT